MNKEQTEALREKLNWLTELEILGTMLVCNSYLEIADDYIDESDFLSDETKELYACFHELYEEGKLVDILTVSERLKQKGKEELWDTQFITKMLNNVPSTLNDSHFLDLLKSIVKESFRNDFKKRLRKQDSI